jgi:hypothetical protein
MPAAAGKLSNGRAFKSRRSEVGGPATDVKQRPGFQRTAVEEAEKAEVEIMPASSALGW